MDKEKEKAIKGYINFDEYIRHGEPNKRERAELWNLAIGLQAVDGLKTSNYLHETARRHIEGELTIDEARQLIKQYYLTKTPHNANDDDAEEADKVSGNIVKVLNSPTFSISVNGYISVHRRIFEGVFKHAGELRPYDITKQEWVLRGDTVNYLNWEDLRNALDYDLRQEAAFDHTKLSMEEFVRHISQFVADIWQIHAFREGNTRTTAVFTVQYLRSLGFNVENTSFAEHSWYFRNALVRANYSNYQKRILRDTSFLEMFFRNLLMGENNELKNRYMLINPPIEWQAPQKENLNDTNRTSTEQVAEQVAEQVRILVMVIGREHYTLKQLMDRMGLKHRPNFLENYIEPAIREKYVRLLYPDKPRHPRQKYMLTVKGTILYNEMASTEY